MKTKTYTTWDEIEKDYWVYTGAIDNAGISDESLEDSNFFIACDLQDKDAERCGVIIIDYVAEPGKLTCYIFDEENFDDEARAYAQKLVEPYKSRKDFSGTWYFMDEEEE